MRIILLGPPGVGKGTQAKFLIERLDAVQLSTGDLLRAAIREGAELGETAKRFMDAGELVPDDVILGLVREELAKLGDRCVIFDGFPRTIAQAEGLDSLLDGSGHPLDKVVELVVDDEIIVDRLSCRRSCPKCGSVYNLQYQPPKRRNVCDRCGHEGLILRDDDREEVIRKRLSVYHDQTSPLSEYYEGHGMLARVDGDQPMDVVQDEIREVLGK